MKTIAGIFDSSVAADTAVAQLLDNGFTKDDISLIMTDQTRNRLFNSTDDEANRAAKGGVTGAVIGGVLGALLVGLTSVGAIVFPAGGLLLAGPIVAALSGAGAGATIGGLSGALIECGFAADDANRYEDEIKRGKAVVVVHASDEKKAALARLALKDAGATTKAA